MIEHHAPQGKSDIPLLQFTTHETRSVSVQEPLTLPGKTTLANYPAFYDLARHLKRILQPRSCAALSASRVTSREALGCRNRVLACALREMTNFTYDLDPLNMEHLAWFVAHITGKKRSLRSAGTWPSSEDDTELRQHVRRATLKSDLRHFADADAKYCRRAGCTHS